jgi:hypothetical protein
MGRNVVGANTKDHMMTTARGRARLPAPKESDIAAAQRGASLARVPEPMPLADNPSAESPETVDTISEPAIGQHPTSTSYPGLVGVRTGRQFRDFLVANDHYLAGILAACLCPIVYSRHHWLLYKGEYHVRADLRRVLEELPARDPGTWDDEESDLVLALFALCISAVGLDELKDRADTSAVREVLEERLDAYVAALDSARGSHGRPDGLIDLAELVTAMRTTVQRSHYLYSIIDGKAWYRTEGLGRHDQIDDQTLTDSVERVLAVDFGVAPGPPTLERLRQATRGCLAQNGDSAPLIRAIMAATLEDPVLRADHVTLTCPMGDLLDSPELMTTSEAFFTETQLRDGLDLGGYEARLVHDSPDQLQRTIRARMLKLKRGAIRGLYGPGCLQGRFVEKHGGHMIFHNEDAHYRGHQSIGCSSGGRASFALRFRCGGQDGEMTPMVGDYRVVRMSDDERETFTAADLVQVIRYAEWIRTVVEETYRHGRVIRKDKIE